MAISISDAMRSGLIRTVPQQAPAPRPLPNNGLGLLPRDLLADAVQADNVPAKITDAVSAYQQSREQHRPPSPQPDWSQQMMTTAIAFNNPFIQRF